MAGQVKKRQKIKHEKLIDTQAKDEGLEKEQRAAKSKKQAFDESLGNAIPKTESSDTRLRTVDQILDRRCFDKAFDRPAKALAHKDVSQKIDRIFESRWK